VAGVSSRQEINAVRGKRATSGHAKEQEHPPHRVRLPGFIADEDIGLGDVITRVTRSFGIPPCDGCNRRAAALNRWFVFTGRAK
jgi:hypothetical protein